MSQRTEETFRCPHDGRAVAKVIVMDGARHIWFPPSRNGYLVSVRQDLEGEIRRWQGSSHSDELKQAIVERTQAAIDLMASDPNKLTPEQIEPLPSDFDLSQHEIGFEPLSRWGNCPRCHRLYELQIGKSEAGRWSAVLRSVALPVVIGDELSS